MKETLHKHHIIQRYKGGSDDANNIIELTRAEHANTHLQLYKQDGDLRDLWAYNILMGQTDEAVKIGQVLGGLAQGKINSESGHMARIRLIPDRTEVGKKGANTCRINKVNAFFDPKLKNAISSKGGKTQGKINVESGHLLRISKIPRKKTNKGCFWVTNGVDSKLLQKDDPIPDGYKNGRICPRKEK